jgi:hypothetical protein
MRSFRPVIAAALVAAVPSILAIRYAAAQETISVTEDSALTGLGAQGDACGCRNVQAPPWHASVRGPECRSACHACGVFHANPCGQLHPRRHIHGPVMLPPFFPRLHTWCAEGYMPTPPPLAQPRCHRCGAPIEGGF